MATIEPKLAEEAAAVVYEGIHTSNGFRLLQLKPGTKKVRYVPI